MFIVINHYIWSNSGSTHNLYKKKKISFFPLFISVSKDITIEVLPLLIHKSI